MDANEALQADKKAASLREREAHLGGRELTLLISFSQPQDTT